MACLAEQLAATNAAPLRTRIGLSPFPHHIGVGGLVEVGVPGRCTAIVQCKRSFADDLAI
jgi:hypothetical protein